MSLINKVYLAYASKLLRDVDNSRRHPIECQRETFKYLLKNGADSSFGYEHGLNELGHASFSYDEFRKKVPVRDYNEIQPYIERLRKGEDYVLWNQKVKWFAKSSGTSSDKSKFIPITPDALWGCHYKGFKTLLASYLDLNPKSKMFDGKSLTLGGSVHLDNAGSASGANFSGDLSAILLQNTPRIAEWKRVPSRETALISSFDEKMERICKECSKENVTTFSGVPSWNLIMIRKLLDYNGAKYLTDIWPNIELFMHGGINFGPYVKQYHELIPKKDMHYLENYNASEGYFAFQDVLNDSGMLLTLSNGVFYEFIPMDDIDKYYRGIAKGRKLEEMTIPLEEVKAGVSYAMVITTNSGLWRYLIGDCVKFTSISPYKIIISGRTQMYINAFGEEFMIGNAELALAAACKKCGVEVSEFMVAPIFMEDGKRGAHQWVVELDEGAEVASRQNRGDRSGDESGHRSDLSVAMSAGEGQPTESFAAVLDEEICKRNSDYEAKRKESLTMDRLVLTVVPKGTFFRWMESKGKIGGQNKVPRLSSDRTHIEELLKFK